MLSYSAAEVYARGRCPKKVLTGEWSALLHVFSSRLFRGPLVRDLRFDIERSTTVTFLSLDPNFVVLLGSRRDELGSGLENSIVCGVSRC